MGACGGRRRGAAGGEFPSGCPENVGIMRSVLDPEGLVGLCDFAPGVVKRRSGETGGTRKDVGSD